MDSCFIIVNRQTIRSVNLDSYTERDFNNYTSQGWYSFGSTPESLGLINCPGRSTGTLLFFLQDCNMALLLVL